MQYTEVAPSQSAREIVDLLVEFGATRVEQLYFSSRMSGLSFTIQPPRGPGISFDLPIRVGKVEEQLKKKRPSLAKDKLTQLAERIAWRQLLRWVEAQLAMVETGMVQTHEVFTPYARDPETGQTLFEVMESRRLLPAAKEKANG